MTTRIADDSSRQLRHQPGQAGTTAKARTLPATNET